MDRKAATVAGIAFGAVVGAGTYLLSGAVVLAGATGIAWGIAAGVRTSALGREVSIDGPDWWTATTVSVALLVAVPGLAYLSIPPDVRLGLGVAFLGVGAAGAALGEARERAIQADAGAARSA